MDSRDGGVGLCREAADRVIVERKRSLGREEPGPPSRDAASLTDRRFEQATLAHRDKSYQHLEYLPICRPGKRLGGGLALPLSVGFSCMYTQVPATGMPRLTMPLVMVVELQVPRGRVT